MKNKADQIIETSSWIVMIVLLIKFVPRNRIREASVIFACTQFMTWIFGLMVVEKNLIQYPKRLSLRMPLNRASLLSVLSTQLCVYCLIYFTLKIEVRFINFCITSHTLPLLPFLK